MKKKEDSYKATIKVMGKTYEASGSDVSSALLGLKPLNCKGKGILTIQHGDVKKEKVLMPMQAFRLFNTLGLSREIALKNVSNLFSGL
jgi:hypothetical protein